MKVVVNGEPRHLAEDASVRDLVTELGRDRRGRGIAVAVNGEVVPRSQWETTRLVETDGVEVLDAVGGG